MGTRYFAIIGVVGALGMGVSAAAQETVSFAEILRNPGDLRLNLIYAQQREEAGDLIAAAKTLERLLIAEPNWDEVRLYYAGILYDLGDYEGARREAQLLEGRDFSSSTLAMIENFKKGADRKTNKTRVSGRFSAGIGYDDNAGSQLVEDPSSLDATLESVDQFSLILRGRVRIEHDLSSKSDLKAFAEGNATFKRFEDEDFDGFAVLDGKAGFEGEFGRTDWRGNLSVRNVSIGGDSYLTETGIEGRLVRELRPKTKASVKVGYHDQSYSNVFGPGDNSELRDGERFDVRASLRHAFSARLQGTIGADYRDKTADLADFAYEFVGVSGGLDAYWPGGNYVDTTLIYRDYEYDAGREDEFVYARAAFGLPMSTLSDSAALEPFVFEAAINFSDRQSNQDIYDFDNTGAEVRLIYRF